MTVYGQLLDAAGFDDEAVMIDLCRVLTGHDPEDAARSAGAGAAGVVLGTWRTDPQSAPVTSILAVVRAAEVLP